MTLVIFTETRSADVQVFKDSLSIQLFPLDYASHPLKLPPLSRRPYSFASTFRTNKKPKIWAKEKSPFSGLLLFFLVLSPLSVRSQSRGGESVYANKRALESKLTTNKCARQSFPRCPFSETERHLGGRFICLSAGEFTHFSWWWELALKRMIRIGKVKCKLCFG